jgi:hypothetical protein
VFLHALALVNLSKMYTKILRYFFKPVFALAVRSNAFAHSISEYDNDSCDYDALFLDHYACLKLSLQDIDLVAHTISG